MKIALIGASGLSAPEFSPKPCNAGIRSRPLSAIPKRSSLAQESHCQERRTCCKSTSSREILCGPRRSRQLVQSRTRRRRSRSLRSTFAGHKAVIAAVKKSGVKRFLSVGGAASLKTPEGIEFIDSPHFPAAYEPYKPGIRGMREFYYLLKKEPIARLGLHRSVGDHRARRAHRKIPRRQGRGALRQRWREQDFGGRLRRRPGRRTRAPAAPPRAHHHRLLTRTGQEG